MVSDEKRFRREIFEEKVYGEPATGIVIDIGGHIGLYTEYCQPTATMIYTIEPSKENFKVLSERVKNWSNVKAFNLAIAGQRENRILYSGGSDGAYSLYNTGVAGSDKEDVQAMSLKEFMEENGITKIDTIKTDCEGAEGEIMKRQSLAEVIDKIDRIVGELHVIIDSEFLKEQGFSYTCTNQIFEAKRIK